MCHYVCNAGCQLCGWECSVPQRQSLHEAQACHPTARGSTEGSCLQDAHQRCLYVGPGPILIKHLRENLNLGENFGTKLQQKTLQSI